MVFLKDWKKRWNSLCTKLFFFFFVEMFIGCFNDKRVPKKSLYIKQRTSKGIL